MSKPKIIKEKKLILTEEKIIYFEILESKAQCIHEELRFLAKKIRTIK